MSKTGLSIFISKLSLRSNWDLLGSIAKTLWRNCTVIDGEILQTA